MRTISATSVNGSEQSFVDKGFDDLSLDANNYFENQEWLRQKLMKMLFSILYQAISR